MLHAEVRAIGRVARAVVQPLDEPFGLRARGVEQREHVADRLVAILQLLQVLGGGRAATADVGVVALDVARTRGRAVGHDEHADRGGAGHVAVISIGASRWVRECTSSTRRPSVSGGVSGSTP